MLAFGGKGLHERLAICIQRWCACHYLQLVAFFLDAHFPELQHLPCTIAAYLRVLKIDHIHIGDMNEPCLPHGVKVPAAQNALRYNSRFYGASQLPLVSLFTRETALLVCLIGHRSPGLGEEARQHII